MKYKIRYLHFTVTAISVVCIFILFNRAIFNSNQAIWGGTDYTCVQHSFRVANCRAFNKALWSPTYWLGQLRGFAPLYPSSIILIILPEWLSGTVNIVLHILVAITGGWYAAKTIGCSKYGAAFASISFGFTTHFISLINAGHLGKIQCIPWIPWTFAFFWRAWKTHKIYYFIASSITYAFMWQSDEAQIPYYLGLYLIMIALLHTFKILTYKNKLSIKIKTVLRLVSFSFITLLLTLILSLQNIEKFYNTFKKMDISPAIKVANKNDTQGYEFATQWSFPPEETFIFILSDRLFGYQSPVYWGRHGTETFHMTQVGHYTGVMVVICALISLMILKHKSKNKIFLLFILISSLFISFGRFSPVYRIILMLPTIPSHRVPARWVIFFSFALTLLAGMGFEEILYLIKLKGKNQQSKLLVHLPTIICISVSIIFIIIWKILNSSPLFPDKYFGISGIFAKTTYPEIMQKRAELFISSFLLSAGNFFITAILIFLLHIIATRIPVRYKNKALYLWTTTALIFIAADLNINNRQYISFYNPDQLCRTDSLIKILKNDNSLFRIYSFFPQQHPYLNQLTTLTGPYHGLRFAEPPANPRVNEEYMQLFNNLMNTNFPHYALNPKFYDIFAIKYILSAAKLPESISNRLNVKIKEIINFINYPPLYLYQYTNYLPNPSWSEAWTNITSVDNVMKYICESDPVKFPAIMAKEPLCAEKTTGFISNIQISTPFYNKFDNSNNIFSPLWQEVKFKVNCNGPGLVLLREKYDPAWQALLNGKNVSILKANIFHMAIYIPEKGEHSILLKITPPYRSFFLTGIAWLILLGGYIIRGILKII